MFQNVKSKKLQFWHSGKDGVWGHTHVFIACTLGVRVIHWPAYAGYFLVVVHYTCGYQTAISSLDSKIGLPKSGVASKSKKLPLFSGLSPAATTKMSPHISLFQQWVKLINISTLTVEWHHAAK